MAKNELISIIKSLTCKNEYRNMAIDDAIYILDHYSNYNYIQEELTNKINQIKRKYPHLSKLPNDYEKQMLKIKSIIHGNKDLLNKSN